MLFDTHTLLIGIFELYVLYTVTLINIVIIE